MARRRMKPSVAAFAEDHTLVARFVDIWRRPPKLGKGPFKEGEAETPIAINDIAWELGIGQSKAAVTMKWAEQDGWVRRTNPRTEQAAYEPTEKALRQYPASGVQVMPEQKTTEIAKGLTVRGETAEEARSWDTRGDLVPAEPRRRDGGLVEPKQGFKGYLEEGSDDAT